MKAPQIILVALLFIDLLIAANKHGKQKTGKFDFWVTFTSTATIILLIWWGGFFD
jgi:L-asparagine transporter-like permease